MNYFLGISCEEYSNCNNICFCHADSLRIYQVLTDYCDYDKTLCECKVLYINDTENTGVAILNRIKEICNSLNDNDVFVLFFAGHGSQKNGDALLLLPDYEEDNPSSALSLGVIRDVFAKAKGFCVAIIDACHSGTEIQPIDLNAYCARDCENGWAILASCSGQELSYPYVEKEQGAFSYFLANCIEEWKNGHPITVEELKNRVCDAMSVWCRENNKVQRPTINGSIIGTQQIAMRNDKLCRNEIIPLPPNMLVIEKENEMNELTIAENSQIVLWDAQEGLALQKNADVPMLLGNNKNLPIKTIESIKRNYEQEDYESVSELIWEKSISILRKRILVMGTDFVCDMIGMEDDRYVNDLPTFEVINLAAELGFIDALGKMRLNHANELVLHYRNENVSEEMPRNEIETIVRACVQYIIGYEEGFTAIEFTDFRNTLKRENLTSNRLEVLQQSPYFYKKTTLRTLFNLLKSTEGAEYEFVAANFISIIEIIWESLSSDDRYAVGTNYSRYANDGNKNLVGTFKFALEKVHGFDYVPENLRSVSFVNAAKLLKAVHNSYNNFYNEPEAARKLERLGTKIPRPAIKECVSACMICLTGNKYGRSEAAVDILKEILNKLDASSWKYYVDECLEYDEDLLTNLANGDMRIEKWFEIVNEYGLNNLQSKDGRIQEMLNKSAQGDKANAKACIIALLKRNNKFFVWREYN